MIRTFLDHRKRHRVQRRQGIIEGKRTKEWTLENRWGERYNGREKESRPGYVSPLVDGRWILHFCCQSVENEKKRDRPMDRLHRRRIVDPMVQGPSTVAPVLEHLKGKLLFSCFSSLFFSLCSASIPPSSPSSLLRFPLLFAHSRPSLPALPPLPPLLPPATPVFRLHPET